jgi:hypothetical protein
MGLHTFTAVDRGRQVSLNSTFYWEMLHVDKREKKLYSLPLQFKGRSRKAQAACTAILLQSNSGDGRKLHNKLHDFCCQQNIIG